MINYKPLEEHGTVVRLVACSICGAVTEGQQPHALGEMCPLAVKRAEAEVEMLNAQRDYYMRAQMPMLDMGEAMRALTRTYEQE